MYPPLEDQIGHLYTVAEESKNDQLIFTNTA